MRQAAQVLHDIDQFHPVDGHWLALDDLLGELWSLGTPPPESLPVLFGVFERFPDDDGALGVLWSIVHGIESLPYAYDALLTESYRRCPSKMAEIMLARLAKSVAAR
ncbi:hypothetical protein [Comamonas sp. JUb58]|uniref:hypothetical protein n=1 Tax=Comamonas sp. JUb58 TaxID=2485114 RepID=UPI00105EC8F9|nr:hypothetical protein [Comamonas sp. JUb58]